MKAIFKFNGKTITNEQIEGVSILIKLGKKFEGNYYGDNEEYVIDKLEEESDIFKIDKFEIECPIYDYVYLRNMSFTGIEGAYPDNENELEILKKSYNEVIKVFGEDKVSIAVYSDYLYDDYTEDDFSLEEFLNNFSLKEEI